MAEIKMSVNHETDAVIGSSALRGELGGNQRCESVNEKAMKAERKRLGKETIECYELPRPL